MLPVAASRARCGRALLADPLSAGSIRRFRVYAPPPAGALARGAAVFPCGPGQRLPCRAALRIATTAPSRASTPRGRFVSAEEAEPASSAPFRVSETVGARSRTYRLVEGEALTWRWDELGRKAAAADSENPKAAETEGACSAHHALRGANRPRILRAGLSAYHSANSWLRAMFLPVGYPSSVHPCYARVHWWQFVETVVWSAVSAPFLSCRCTPRFPQPARIRHARLQAMLASLGLTSAQATGGAVAIQWRFSHSLDSHPKTWKLVSNFTAGLKDGIGVREQEESPPAAPSPATLVIAVV
ncbi:MAG: hypothetical protein BJ554DRAFT_960 [Olpidium bornovanus]|uniref:Protein root UVB sensitive/RUS domain-containing protein n=1 Tax=Olpidium bornovanus TaxID=278681 RepID=A0A8H7ZSR9_9FUNG|nr:MAG: hypothetical protein BJ554DRAFT_960 [Olpidium bornovanus]